MTHYPEEEGDLPKDWPIKRTEDKVEWFIQRRAYKQAIRQDTSFGRAHSEAVEYAKENDTDHGPNVPDDEADDIEGRWLRDAFIEAEDENQFKIDDDTVFD
jgi:hypothetical protein